MQNTTQMNNHSRNVDELNAAQTYIFKNKVIVIGRSDFDAELFARIKMPAMPLLMSNREQRLALIKPWFIKRCLESAVVKFKSFKCTVKQAIQQEKQKCMHLFNWQMLLQAPLPHERQDNSPMTWEQFNAWCTQSEFVDN